MSSEWTTLESLILAQAVIKYGEVWSTISKTLKNHPSVKNDSMADPNKPSQLDFSIKTCAARWSELVEEYETQQRKNKREAAVQEVPANVRITQSLYVKRMEELKASIKADEAAYNRILREVEDIQSGKKDHELMDMMKQIKKTPVLIPEKIAEEPQKVVKEEPADMEIEANPNEAPKEEPIAENVTPVKQTATKGREQELEGSQEKEGDKEKFKEKGKETPLPTPEVKGEEEDDEEDYDAPLSLTKAKALQKEESQGKKESPDHEKTKAQREAEGKKEELSVRKKVTRIRSRGGSTEGDGVGGDDAESPLPDYSLSPSKKGDRHRKAWLKNVLNVLQQISGHKHAWAFKDPVKKEDAPNYYDVIKKPTNLTAIKKKLTDGVIQTTLEFHREVMLLFTNAMVFNNHYHEVHGMAVEMCAHFEELIKDLELQEFSDNPELTSTVHQLLGDSDAEEVPSPSKRRRDSPTKMSKRRRL